MNCESLREEIQARLDARDARPSLGPEAEAHLLGCENCAAYARDVASTVAALRAAPEEEPPEGFAEGVMARIGAEALAGELSYGDQRRLEIARALASEPRLLMLDEPAAGMNPAETGRLRELIRALVDEGLTILLIEHDVRLVMGTCERIAVLSFGRKIAEGEPAEIQGSAVVREAYLGSEDIA